jgi:predicted nuclease of restriction endonuclease-like (RecB) superfamily
LPSLKPFNAIKYLSSQTLSGKYNNAGYLFYENSKGFHFRSLESMLAMGGAVARPTRWNFQSQIQMVKDGKQDEVKDIERRMQNVIKLEFGKQVDTLANIIDGLYANRVIVHDAFNKTIKTHDFNYKDNYAKGYHLESLGEEGDSFKFITPETQLNDTGKSLYELPNSKKMVVTETSRVHNDYEFTPTSSTLPKITSQMAGFKNMNLSLLVYGNTSLNCGDVINYSAPIMQPGEKKAQNPYTSGRYLIMAIKHTISVESRTHEMVLRCFKDSVRTPYPKETDPLITGKEYNDKIDIYNEDISEL